MPELPEVETIATALREGGRKDDPAAGDPPQVTGRRILAAHLSWERTLAAPDPDTFRERIVGQRIESVGRRGKFLILELSDDTMLVHLRMSGDLIVGTSDQPFAPHDRLVLDLEGGLRLAFNDARKFGRVWMVSDPQMVLAGLGPEPLDPDFTSDLFFRRLQERRRQLKPLLMDQKFLAGLGNIYTDEALFLARLHPLEIANTLTEADAGRLHRAIRQVLEEGIRRNGASIDWAYRGGNFQNAFQVYGRAGEPCPRCGGAIERLVVGQRGTHICPTCQRSKRLQD